MKYCLAPRTLNRGIHTTLLKLAYSIRTKYHLTHNGKDTEYAYIPQTYQKNTDWNPPPASNEIENQLTLFGKALRKEHELLLRKYRNASLSNLTPLQSTALKKLRENHDIILKPTDKNLGPAAMDREAYINQIFTEHLSTQDYLKLSQQEAIYKLQHIKERLKKLLTDNKDKLTQPEIIYFDRSLKTQHRIPLFYGLPKVHKQPISLRPVVSTTNSLLAIFSNWLDYKMKELLPLVKSYTKNSAEVIQDLKQLTLPHNALLFSADAKSMYTNIDTDTGLNAMRDFLTLNSSRISTSFPTNLFLQILEIVMRNNIFSFQDTYWIQLSGTAMGTPVACSYATVTYGQHENTAILPEFSNNLLYFKRYIDDIFGIWIPSDNQNTKTWESFKTALNSWGKLSWVIEEPSSTTNFLDLTLKISNLKICTKTFQKDMNLYLYIPARSAHPPSCLKGLIMGETRRYWIQNNKADFTTILAKFIQRLTERGHKLEDLAPLFNQAAAALDTNILRQSQQNSDKNDRTIFLHWEYHPKGIKRPVLRKLFDTYLAPVLDYEKMVVAVSRPPNLKDLLTRAALPADSHAENNTLVTRH